jgi:hypothetical protein
MNFGCSLAPKSYQEILFYGLKTIIYSISWSRLLSAKPGGHLNLSALIC